MKKKFQLVPPAKDASASDEQDRGQPARRRAHERAAPALAARIEQAYAAMPPSEKSVANLLLESPGRLATHSATELASLARSSKAAVTRCMRRLGYESFALARADARQAQQWGSPLYLAAVGEASARRSDLDAHVAADVEILNKTRDALSEDDLTAAAHALAGARRVVVLGFRNSHLLAGFARAQLGLLRPNVELVPTAGETLAEGLAELGRSDVVLALGFRRRVPTFVRALEVAHRAGARIVYVTDPSGSVAPRTATWTLRCHCRGASLFDSYVGAISVLNYLAARVASLVGEPARKRLQDVERMHGELGDLI
ncbi:MAG TPA: MurR/RpiR family transcriptional regulator [Burkholderiaceae bacterium]